MTQKSPATSTPTKAQTPPKGSPPSPTALTQVSETDIRFAQTALKQLGFRLGRVDGIWGDRSASAMRQFERRRGLKSAGGALSELNLYTLSQFTKVRKSDIQKSVQSSTSLIAKIDRSVPLEKAPQLIIVDQRYSVLASANPYSKVLATLQPGTGVYVLSIQEGWFEVESLQKLKGFIREN